MNWNNKIADFLRTVPSKSAFRQLDEEILPFAAWTQYAAPQLLLVPNGVMAEKLASSLKLLGGALGENRKVVLLPELPGGKLRTPELEAEFLATLFGVLKECPDYIVAAAGVLIQSAPRPEVLADSELVLRAGSKVDFTALLDRLVKWDYDEEFEVVSPGEFARRGGLIDIFSPAHPFPVRLDFWGDQLESIRRFSPETQRSDGAVDEYRVIACSTQELDNGGAMVADYVRKLKLEVKLIYPELCYNQLKTYSSAEKLSEFMVAYGRLPVKSVTEWGDIAGGEGSKKGGKAKLFGCFPAVAHLVNLLPEEIVESSLELLREQISGQIKQWLNTGYTVFVGVGADEAAKEHVARWREVYGIADNALIPVAALLPAGVIFPELKQVFLNEKELFAANLQRKVRSGSGAVTAVPPRRKLKLDTSGVIADLNEGDYAVHLTYGIGIFRGIRILQSHGVKREVMVLEYADDKLLYVPMYQSHLISRYLGSAGKVPLHRLNSRKWQNDKNGAMRSVREYAADLLRMQAVRYNAPNLPLPPEDYEQLAFENGIDFELTVDQQRAIAEIKADLNGEHPMDRLLCGDVGFGKTEVAMVAAFRMVYAGYQVAVLAPTTVLAQQHFYSFRERFAEYGVNIDMLSRFRSAAEQKTVMERLADGTLDIVIGTHRLCQGDIKFANLGMVIIDEEQRFGVKHKEILRRLRADINVLSMSATPIPRTLYLAMAGARDLSTIMTAPMARLPVKTIICEENDKALLSAINLELNRGGQVYYLHNRVKTIETCALRLKEDFPAARIAIAHGQMDEDELESIMASFIAGDIDILVCTTIIESGMDVQNANTIIIERADRFGLAELYQLRGRVGRWINQAYACLLLPRAEMMTLDGRKRIAAIRRYTHLGAGFQLALRDLEIRGCGNLLGKEQSGHVKAIGFELYCHLLTNEIKALKGEKPEFLPEVEISLDFVAFTWEEQDGMVPAGIPPEYIESERLRVEAYRKLARAVSEKELNDLRDEFCDRYGKLPRPAENFFALTLIRILAAQRGYISVVAMGGTVLFRDGAGHPFRINGKLPLLGHTLKPAQKLVRMVEFARKLGDTV